MFTGLVEGIGTVLALEPAEQGLRIVVDLGPLAQGVGLGDSICTGGTCLSVTTIDGSVVSYDVSPESLEKTSLGNLKDGSKVNIERSLRVGDRLGGHFLTGHVDGLGSLVAIEQQVDFAVYTFECPPHLWPLLVSKGSVGVEGVSLTVASLEKDRQFTVALIPETLERTTLGGLKPGNPVNLEGDLLGKYVLRFLQQTSVDPDALRKALSLSEIFEQN
ncbi:MAG: riboflavin synthase [Planctomycetota bacterium]|jgi:riboflavin synthase|nr:riboflavin synthase [Planctomycetota bacterium]